MQTSDKSTLQKNAIRALKVSAVLLFLLLVMSFKFNSDMDEVYEFIAQEDCTNALSSLNDIDSSYGFMVSIVKLLPLDSVEHSYRKSWQLKRECEDFINLKNQGLIEDKLNRILRNIKNIDHEILDLRYPADYSDRREIAEEITQVNSARITLFANAAIKLINEDSDKVTTELTSANVSQSLCLNLYYIQSNSFSSSGSKEVISALKLKLNAFVPVVNILCVKKILKNYNPERSYMPIFNIKYGDVPSITHYLIKEAINTSSHKEERDNANQVLVDFLTMHQKFCSRLRDRPLKDRVSFGTSSTAKVTLGRDGKWLPHIQAELPNLYVGCANSMFQKAKVAFDNRKFKDAKKIFDKLTHDSIPNELAEKISHYQVKTDIEIARSERAGKLAPIKGRRYASSGPARVILLNGSSSTLSVAMTGSETVKQQIQPCKECFTEEDKCKSRKHLVSLSVKPGDYNVLVKALSSGRKVKPFIGMYELKEGHFYTQCYVIKTKQKRKY